MLNSLCMFFPLQNHCIREGEKHYQAAQADFLHEIQDYVSEHHIRSLFESNNFTQVVQRYTQLSMLRRTLQTSLVIETQGVLEYVEKHVEDIQNQVMKEIRAMPKAKQYLQFNAIKYWMQMYPVSLFYMSHCHLGWRTLVLK
jgi:hypothetical protein